MSFSKKPLVGIIMGSSSDSRIMKGAAEILDKFNIKHEDQIVSAHRTPPRLSEYTEHAEKMGFKIIIAGAGGARGRRTVQHYYLQQCRRDVRQGAGRYESAKRKGRPQIYQRHQGDRRHKHSRCVG